MIQAFLGCCDLQLEDFLYLICGPVGLNADPPPLYVVALRAAVARGNFVFPAIAENIMTRMEDDERGRQANDQAAGRQRRLRTAAAAV